jgi:hypothetical protein
MHFLGAGARCHACGPSPPADCASFRQLDRPCAGYFGVLGRCGASKHVSSQRLRVSRLRNGCAAAQRQLYFSHATSATRLALYSNPAQPVSVARILFGTSAHGGDPAPARIACTDWTPACSSRNKLANHTSIHPRPAFTPGSSSTPSVHLQTAARNTYQPPNPHRYHHVACCHTL